ncbi:MAG: HlyD family secretion protein [Fischerella sp. CENA71]|nr:HlyD family secretion protein [Fischerella sp. CENA71]
MTTNDTSSKAEEPILLQPELKPEKVSLPKHQKWRDLTLLILGLSAVFFGIFGYQLWQYIFTQESTDNAYVTSNIYPISSRINGTVVEVLVDDNQTVQKDQLLVKLDTKEYQSKVQQALASLQTARYQADAAQAKINFISQNAEADIQQAKGNVSSAMAEVSIAQAAVKEVQAGTLATQATLAQAEANMQKVQADYRRYSNLYKAGAISHQQLDSAIAAYKVAQAQKNLAKQEVMQAQAKLNQALKNVTKAQATLVASKGELQKTISGNLQVPINFSEYEAAKANVNLAEANLEEAKLQLTYTKITGSVQGRIGRKSVKTGQRIETGQSLMVIVDNNYWIVANFKETQLKRMQPGQMVKIKLDAFPNHSFSGYIDSFSPGSGAVFTLLPPDNATGNFTKVVQRIPVKIVFDSASIRGYELRITPGMSATVSVNLKKINRSCPTRKSKVPHLVSPIRGSTCSQS